MFYKYETHLHTSESSACASSTAAEMVQAYIRAGYSGFVVTDHFVNANSTVSRDLTWHEQIKNFIRGYENAYREAEKYNFQVFFGWEYTVFPYCEDHLTYNLDINFLYKHPELTQISFSDYCKLVHESGGILIHAHPYREASYIHYPPNPKLDLIDGIEVNNGSSDSPYNHNDKAWELARSNPKLIRTSGTDIHNVQKVGLGGVAFKYKITSMKEFVKALQNHEAYLIIDGRITDRDGNIVE
ncbi:MAG TPA: PHP domain-containing protein [Acholeplasmataceae bacterium]|nr:PHP domain-containing protein [Acholeplasmataceae bacterium]